MKEIEILGPGCSRCQKLAEVTRVAAAEINLECNIVKVTDYKEYSSYGIVMTPALVVDGVVKSSGKIPSVNEIKSMLR